MPFLVQYRRVMHRRTDSRVVKTGGFGGVGVVERWMHETELDDCADDVLPRVTGGELFEDIVAREFYSEADARPVQ